MSVSPRETLLLDSDWLFHLGDVPAPLANKHLAAYMANKAGYARGAARGNFDDSDWRNISLPHDWSVEGAFDRDNLLNQGYRPRGTGWYRRHFALDDADRGKRLHLTFDGIATHGTVYVNGHCLARNFCGYTPIKIDFTDVASFGEALNTVAVHVDATTIEGWWYEGAGIYRHAWLTKTHPLHIVSGGVFVRTKRIDEKRWQVHVATEVRNASPASCTFAVALSVSQERGWLTAPPPQQIGPGETITVEQIIEVDNPPLWSIETPDLLTLQADIIAERQTVDSTSTRFGFRTVRFDGDRGFFLNEQPVKLLGTCNHQDHAGLGVALPDSMHRFRIQRLKDMGSNAYRCAHNPPASELLDACDELGMLVMDENRNFGSSPIHLDQLRAMVRRDRNHPSIICWSICNEEAIQGDIAAEQIAQTMIDEVKKLDPTRPVTAAVSGGILNERGIINVIAPLSINYQFHLYDALHAKRLKQCIIAAETGCTFGTRGVYRSDANKQVFDSRDTEHAAWGSTARAAWQEVSSRPFVAGLFVWTGFDYRGEPAPHEWPSVNSHWGLFDTCGFAKDAFWLHKAWFSREPFVQLAPHWNWEAGQVVRVIAYTNCPSVELFLNDRPMGCRENGAGGFTWDVSFEPGTLRAIALTADGRKIEYSIQTTAPASALCMEIDPAIESKRIAADGQFAFPVTVFAVDESNRRVPSAQHLVNFELTGPARIIGVGNGDPNCHESDKAPARSLFNGLAQVIIRTTSKAGEITLHASLNSSLKPGRLTVRSQPAAPRPSVPSARRRYLITNWRMSPITPERPNPLAAIDEGDVNSWERIKPESGGQKAWLRAGGYAIYRASAKVPKTISTQGGTLVFERVIGSMEVWLNGERVEHQIGPSGFAKVSLPRAITVIDLVLIVEANVRVAGLAANVELLKGV